MNALTFFGWDKKPRTMLRAIKPGDIFCFKFTEDTFGFGRVLSTMDEGHCAEILDFFSAEPIISEQQLTDAKRVSHPILLNSYGLFDKKNSGEWRIIASEPGYKAQNIEGFYFIYGVPGDLKKIDILGNDSPVSDVQAKAYPSCVPKSDAHVKSFISQHKTSAPPAKS